MDSGPAFLPVRNSSKLSVIYLFADISMVRFQPHIFRISKNVPIPVIIVFLENLRHPLERDAALNEEIKRNGILACVGRTLATLA